MYLLGLYFKNKFPGFVNETNKDGFHFLSSSHNRTILSNLAFSYGILEDY
jgi:hypothetical protein